MAFAIFLAAISHPVLDMFFHDAYVFAGNRAVSRVTFNFWQMYYMEPASWKENVGKSMDFGWWMC